VRKHWETHSLDVYKMVDGVCRTRATFKISKRRTLYSNGLSRFKLIRSDRTVCGESSFAQCLSQCRSVRESEGKVETGLK
jgi:hypothetical protein